MVEPLENHSKLLLIFTQSMNLAFGDMYDGPSLMKNPSSIKLGTSPYIALAIILLACCSSLYDEQDWDVENFL